MMKSGDQVRLFLKLLLQHILFQKNTKEREGKTIISPNKKTEQNCPIFWWEIQLFQFASNFFDAKPETSEEGGKGDFVLDHRWQKNIWKGKEKLTKHYFYQVDCNTSNHNIS